MQLGIEVELWVVDDGGRLCDGQELTEAHDRVVDEFVGPLIEVQTEPHETEAGLRRDLQRTLGALVKAADEDGKRLVPLGTPLTPAAAPATKKRGRLFEDIYGEDVRRAKNCAGTHVHFEKGNVGRQLDLLTALDPALALVSSSPYYLGERRHASSRADAYRGPPGSEFAEFTRLWEYPDGVDEWQERVDSAYSRFRRLAAENGVPPAVVDEHFDPEDAVLNPVRLRRSQPTVEWRAPDATLPSHVVELAFDVARLVRQTDEKSVEIGGAGVHGDRIEIPEFSTLRDLSRDAIDRGMGSHRVREYLERLGFDVTDYRLISSQIRGPRTICEEDARAVRLRTAERFREDVATLTDAGDPIVARDAGGTSRADGRHRGLMGNIEG